MRSFLRSALMLFINAIVSRTPSHQLRLFAYRSLGGAIIGSETSILMGAYLKYSRRIRIGNNSIVNANCFLDGRGFLTIGDNVSVSRDVRFITADHDMNSPTFAYRERPIVVDDYVWIGTGATILPGVTLGRGCVVGTQALVTKDVAPLQVVGGVPAKVISTRDENALQYKHHFHPIFE